MKTLTTSDATTPEPDGSGVVLLFDIDGTLLDARGAGRRALEGAVEEWAGRSLGSFRVHLGGRTDLDIFGELVRVLDVPYPNPPARRAILRRYLERLELELSRTPPAVFPGVRELLARLRNGLATTTAGSESERRIPVHLGLVTGNVLPGARRKLAAGGLDREFDFRFGAFGNDHEDRNELVPLALRRWRGGRALSPEPIIPASRAIVIGDTQDDVDCARAAGSPVLIVGTGFGDYESLAPQADAALPDLADTDEVLETLIRLIPPGVHTV